MKKDNYKELKEKFDKVIGRGELAGLYWGSIWSFIEHSLLTQRKDIIKEIEGMKKSRKIKDLPEVDEDWDTKLGRIFGYNRAISDIINQIKEGKK